MKQKVCPYNPWENHSITWSLTNFLFYKQAMERVKKTAKIVERQPRAEKSGQPNEVGIRKKVRLAWKLIWKARKAIQQATQARRDANNRPYCYWPGEKALCEIRKDQNSMELLIRRMPFNKKSGPRDPSWSSLPSKCHQSFREATESYLIGLLED